MGQRHASNSPKGVAQDARRKSTSKNLSTASRTESKPEEPPRIDYSKLPPVTVKHPPVRNGDPRAWRRTVALAIRASTARRAELEGKPYTASNPYDPDQFVARLQERARDPISKERASRILNAQTRKEAREA